MTVGRTPFEVAAPPGVDAPEVPTAEWIGGLCDRLLAARAALVDRAASDLAGALGRVGERFLDRADALRHEALEALPRSSGLSPEMCVAVLDGMAADWTGARLEELLEAELGGDSALDGFVRRGGPSGRRTMAVGPALCVQIVAGSVPGVGVSALLRSLVLKAPTLLKPGRGDTVLPVLFARELAEADPDLARALAVVYWPGGNDALENAALARADAVVAYGSDETVRGLRARTPVTARFVGYHHRVSVGVVGREALRTAAVAGEATSVAWALALFDQRGCVSPQIVYVEEGGERTPEAFAEALALALAEIERTLPAGPLDPAAASALHQARGTAELVAGAGVGRVIHGGPAAWTVYFEPGGGNGATPPPAPSAGRVARVRPLPSLEQLGGRLEPLAGHLQTVGVTGVGPDRIEAVARAAGRLGASRVVAFRYVPFPPPWWHHDGGGPLGDLVRWVDLEPG
jgi:hypothetical protein